MFSNLTIRSRLIFVIAFLCLQLIIGALVGIIALGFASDATKTIYDDRLVPMGQLDQIVRLLNVNQLILAESLTGDSATLPQQMDQVDANIVTANKVWSTYMATYLTPEEKQLADRFAQNREKFVDEALKPTVTALRAGDLKQASVLVHGPMIQMFQPLREGINALIKLQLDVARSEFEQSQATYRLVRLCCSIGIVLGLLLAIGVGIWVIRAISHPLEAAIRIAGGIAKGDLNQIIEVRTHDETGRLMQALKDMNDSLVKIVSQVRRGTDTIAAASTEIAAGNMDLSSRTEQQAGSLEETASSMEELTSTVKHNADNARQANAMAISASEIASKGGAVVSQVVDTMGSINDSSKKIVDIIGVIDGIAFQTNILALNAAVEAARAGEQGRGFAVVATEVRSLAQRSASAAREIKSLIGDSVQKVDAGARLVDQAGSTMQEIVDSIRSVTDIMGEINSASIEQEAGIAQINQAIAQMDAVTQQNAALVEQAAAASESLQGQAGHLAQVVSVFQIDGQQSAVISDYRAAPARKMAGRRALAPANATRSVGPARQLANGVPVTGEDWTTF